jgi:hypothetical protein
MKQNLYIFKEKKKQKKKRSCDYNAVQYSTVQYSTAQHSTVIYIIPTTATATPSIHSKTTCYCNVLDSILCWFWQWLLLW